jgi:DNA-binding MarR family transcriptional regulator
MSRNESGITSAKLAEICGRNKADVSRAIADFERQSLVARIGDKSYNAKLLLTESGKNIANALAKRAMDAVFLVGGDLEPSEREVFYNTLEKISEKLEFLSEKGIPK